MFQKMQVSRSRTFLNCSLASVNTYSSPLMPIFSNAMFYSSYYVFEYSHNLRARKDTRGFGRKTV